MHAITLSPTTFFLLFFFSVDVTTSFSPNDTLLNCSQTFNCGPLQNISYPFTGGARPPYCGPPGFHLTCPNVLPELTFESVSYRVLQLDQTHQNLTLARSDLSNTTCLHEFANSTLNFTIFSLGSDNKQLSLFYGCSSMAMKPYNQFDCEINGSVSNSYSLVGPVPIDPILDVITCNVSVSVPILKNAADRLISNQSTLAEVLRAGFSVNYSNPYSDHCEKCRHSDGECGFDSELGKPICICGDRLCPEAKNKLSITLGPALAGAGLAGIIVGCWIFYCIQRRKNAAAKSKSVALSSTVPSTNDVPAATNFSRSTRSYPSSKSDLEKGSTYFGVHVFSYTELEEATGNFDSSRELGEGGFGTVYYGKLQDGRVVAVKRLYENNFKRVEQFMNEVEILTRLQHENLVKLYGCTSKRSRELLLVYEYIPNGTVADHLHGNRAKSGLVSWPVRLSIAIETADALAYLHRSDIIHRDVKTNNILLDNNFRVKVADFGLSRLFPTDVTHVSTAPQGTPGYVDPEYYQCYQLTNKSDVYSFGVVLIELISSKQAVDTNRHRHDINLANMAINKIQNHTLHELVDPSLGFEKDNTVRRMTTLVAELAFQCLQQERDMRPSMEEVLKILRGIQSEEVDTQKAEVVDIRVEDVGQLRLLPPQLSPDSVATEKWASDSALPHSF